jgi:sodium/proline symporter
MLGKVGGWSGVSQVVTAKGLTMDLFPKFSTMTFLEIIGMTAGWGLGYFGQPHIVTKFMGIRNVHEIYKSKIIGMTWMFLSLSAATLVGFVGIAYFSDGLQNPELVFIDMVRGSFPPFVIGFILCAVLAATINAMSSQVLVLSSSLTEDFYKRIINKDATSKQLLLVARFGVIFVAMIAFVIAYAQISSIYDLVLYAWSGLGSSFGPLLILSLYWKKINKYGAWAGILSGGIIAGVWPYVNNLLSIAVPSMLPAFTTSFLLIIIISLLTTPRQEATLD